MAKKTKDTDVLILPGRTRTKSKKQGATRKSKKDIKIKKRDILLSHEEKEDNEVLKFMGETEEGDLEIKIMCGNCMKWSKAVKLNIAVNTDKEVLLLWYCLKCRRYNDIAFGKVETRT